MRLPAHALAIPLLDAIRYMGLPMQTFNVVDGQISGLTRRESDRVCEYYIATAAPFCATLAAYRASVTGV